MKLIKLTTLSISAGLLALPLAMAQSQTPNTNNLPSAASYAVNQRANINVSAVEHAHLMTEMNDFMRAIHSINTALASKDFATVSTVATAMGPKGGKHDAVGKAVHDKLPPEWFALARPTHQNFLAIANEAKSNPTVEGVLAKVAATTQQCVACHGSFKLTVAP